MAGEIRVGKVSSVNHGAGTVRVVYPDQDNAVTRELPMLANDTYEMPAVGEMVYVQHLSNGREAGVVLGRAWSGKTMPKESGAGLWRKDFRDGGYLRYKDGILTIKAEKVVILGDLEVQGEIVATGDVTAGSVTMQTHIHTCPDGETSAAK